VTPSPMVYTVLFPIAKIPVAKEAAPIQRAQKGISTLSVRASTPLSFTFITATKGPTQLPTSLDPWAKATQQADIINKGLNRLIAYVYNSSGFMTAVFNLLFLTLL